MERTQSCISKNSDLSPTCPLTRPPLTSLSILVFLICGTGIVSSASTKISSSFEDLWLHNHYEYMGSANEWIYEEWERESKMAVRFKEWVNRFIHRQESQVGRIIWNQWERKDWFESIAMELPVTSLCYVWQVLVHLGKSETLFAHLQNRN